MQDVKQCDGVGPAGNADNNAIFCRDQILPVNRRFDFFNQVHNR
jgi:hypothetical protein